MNKKNHSDFLSHGRFIIFALDSGGALSLKFDNSQEGICMISNTGYSVSLWVLNSTFFSAPPVGVVLVQGFKYRTKETYE